MNIVKSRIPNFSISREKVKWGIPFPYEKKQTIYVWVEALMNYVTVLDFPRGKKFKEFWPADIHIIGAEINKFHSIFWPALLLSIKAPLPKTIFVHGLFTINGQKMSKTLGNIIDPLDLIKKFGKDATRYLLLSQFSALAHGDIKESGFLTKYNDDLANGIGNLLERIFAMIINYRDGVIKEKVTVDKKITALIGKIEISYNQHMEGFRLFEALKDIFLLIKNLDKYINDKEPWVLAKEQNQELDIVLASLFLGVEKIIQWLDPFMPSKVKAVRDYILKMRKKEREHRLNLFPRI